MDKKSRLILLFSTLLFFSSCNTAEYLLKAAKLELNLLSHERKIDEVISDRLVSQVIKNKLRLVLTVRNFGIKNFGLTPGRSFLYYSRISENNLVYVLVAVKSTSWDVKTWWFPIVGRIPYLGFPDYDSALRYGEKLKKSKFDVDIRTAVAFSTLGYLPDPVTSILLEDSSLEVAETLLHEMTHETVYFYGETEFNEHLAILVENIGGIRFAKNYWGIPSPQEKKAEEKWHDTLLFGRFISEVKDELENIYKKNEPDSVKLEDREILLQKFSEEFNSLPFKSDEFNGFKLLPPNNARLLQVLIYYGKINSLYDDFKKCGISLKNFLEFAGKKPSHISPWKWVKKCKKYHG